MFQKVSKHGPAKSSLSFRPWCNPNQPTFIQSKPFRSSSAVRNDASPVPPPKRQPFCSLPLMSHHKRASTLDSSGKLEILQRMRQMPPSFFDRHGKDLLLCDEIMTGDSNKYSSIRSGSSFSKPDYFDDSNKSSKEITRMACNFGSQSLSSNARLSKTQNGLFNEDIEDSPLQMSSIDGVSTQVVKKSGFEGNRQRSQSGDSLAVRAMICHDDCSKDRRQDEEILRPFILMTGDGKFSLSSLKAASYNDFDNTSKKIKPPFASNNLPSHYHDGRLEKVYKCNQKYVYDETEPKGSTNATSTLKSKMRAVQERYRKSAVATKLKSKLSSKSSKSGNFQRPNLEMSKNKYMSNSHGALHSLDKFQGKMQPEKKNERIQNSDIYGYTNCEVIEQRRAANSIPNPSFLTPPELKKMSTSHSIGSSQTFTGNCSPSPSSHPGTPRSGSQSEDSICNANEKSHDFDKDSGIFNEVASDSISSVSDSGFSHAGFGKGRACSICIESSDSKQRCCHRKIRGISSSQDSNHDTSSKCSETDSKQSKQKPIRLKKKKSELLTTDSKVTIINGTSIRRRHSRASSVDRRDIFRKYVQDTNELLVRPYVCEDPELSRSKGTNRENVGPEAKDDTCSSMKKEFRLVRITGQLWHNKENSFLSNLGVFIARSFKNDIGCPGYFISHIVNECLVAR